MAKIETWREAEELAARHLRELGFPDARLTGGSADGGIDVAGRNIYAQVKFERSKTTGRPALQNLHGASHRAKRGERAFFSVSGYSAAAVAYAEDVGIALFRFNVDGQVQPVNLAARNLTGGEWVSVEHHGRETLGPWTGPCPERVPPYTESSIPTVGLAGVIGVFALLMGMRLVLEGFFWAIIGVPLALFGVACIATLPTGWRDARRDIEQERAVHREEAKRLLGEPATYSTFCPRCGAASMRPQESTVGSARFTHKCMRCKVPVAVDLWEPGVLYDQNDLLPYAGVSSWEEFDEWLKARDRRLVGATFGYGMSYYAIDQGRRKDGRETIHIDGDHWSFVVELPVRTDEVLTHMQMAHHAKDETWKRYSEKVQGQMVKVLDLY